VTEAAAARPPAALVAKILRRENNVISSSLSVMSSKTGRSLNRATFQWRCCRQLAPSVKQHRPLDKASTGKDARRLLLKLFSNCANAHLGFNFP
jgi:hypothetical protein